MIKTKAYPRAGLIGNPSDGYYGKTISFVFNNFECAVKLKTNDTIRICSDKSEINFENIEDFTAKIQNIDFQNLSGPYEEHKLLLATIWKFNQYSLKNHGRIIDSPFEIKYTSTIPRSVGLAGSSAIITAAVRALMEFLKIQIPISILPDFILSVETEELNISAGLQDRVAQVYEYPISMDFSKELQSAPSSERYKPIGNLKDIKLYIAYPNSIQEPSSVAHNNLKERYDSGDLQILVAMQAFAGLASAFATAMEAHDLAKLNRLINQNYDLRKKIMPINPQFQEIIDLARSTGASAKFTGSGGAIIGIYENDNHFSKLESALLPKDISVIRPDIINRNEN